MITIKANIIFHKLWRCPNIINVDKSVNAGHEKTMAMASPIGIFKKAM